MRAVSVTSASASGERRLTLEEYEAPVPVGNEVKVAVKAISLNNGEVHEALAAPVGYRPGWDFAGIVEFAPDGSAFAAGDRVVGLKPEGAWAESVTLFPSFLAPIPDDVSFEAGATLPVAGMTAALALAKKTLMYGNRILITAATGGVGLFAIQLAAAAGVHVTAYLRSEADVALLRGLPVHAVAVGELTSADGGPYDLILEGVGGQLLGHALSLLAPRGVCVQFGDAAGDELTVFDAKAFRLGPGGLYGGTSLHGFSLGEELTRPLAPSAGFILADLASRLSEGTLDPVINQRGSWRDIDEVSRAIMARRLKGKAVLAID